MEKNHEKSPKIDVHAHLIPSFYVREMKKRGTTGSLWTSFPHWTPEKDRKVMQKNGIGKRILSLSLPGVTTGDRTSTASLARRCNDYSAELRERHPQNYGAFTARPLPDPEASLKEIAYALDVLKLDGVTLFSNEEGIYWSGEEYTPLFEELNQREAVVFLHPKDLPIDYGRYRILGPIVDRCVDTGRSFMDLFLKGILSRFDKIRYILSHGGGSFPVALKQLENQGLVPQEAYAGIKDRLFFDTAQQGGPLYAFLKSFCGVSQLLFGTDGGWQSPVQVAQTVNALERYPRFSDGEKERIYRHNAAKLFPL